MPDEAEKVLLERFTHGDQNAFERLFKQFELEVYRWVARIVRDSSAAEDVLVEAFWRAYRDASAIRPVAEFGAWMRRIATNAALDHLRRETAARTVADPRRNDAGTLVPPPFWCLPT